MARKKKDSEKSPEIASLEARIRELELQNLALNTLIDVAERNGIEIRKKIWGQAVEEPNGQHGHRCSWWRQPPWTHPPLRSWNPVLLRTLCTGTAEIRHTDIDDGGLQAH